MRTKNKIHMADFMRLCSISSGCSENEPALLIEPISWGSKAGSEKSSLDEATICFSWECGEIFLNQSY